MWSPAQGPKASVIVTSFSAPFQEAAFLRGLLLFWYSVEPCTVLIVIRSDMKRNRLSGTIPRLPAIGLATALSQNRFSGTVSPDLWGVVWPIQIAISDNRLSGTLASNFATKVINISLDLSVAFKESSVFWVLGKVLYALGVPLDYQSNIPVVNKPWKSLNAM